MFDAPWMPDLLLKLEHGSLFVSACCSQLANIFHEQLVL